MKEIKAQHLQRIENVFSTAPFVVYMGIKLLAVRQGWCRTSLSIENHHLQHLNVVHGGVLSALSGHTALAAAMSVDENEISLVAPDFSISIMRSARSGELQAEARVLKAGRQMIFVLVDVYQVCGEQQIAIANGRFTLNRVRETGPAGG